MAEAETHKHMQNRVPDREKEREAKYGERRKIDGKLSLAFILCALFNAKMLLLIKMPSDEMHG